jgi:hypothetical protein
LGYVHREVSFGEDEKRAKKAVYRLADPFLRLWFKTVASHRSRLRTATAAGRKKCLEPVWPQLQAEAWEELCRLALPRMRLFDCEWGAASRHWRGNQSEWDAVSASLDGEKLILGECKALSRPARKADIDRIVRSLMHKSISPDLSAVSPQKELAIFVPSLREKPGKLPDGITLVEGEQVFAALKS